MVTFSNVATIDGCNGDQNDYLSDVPWLELELNYYCLSILIAIYCLNLIIIWILSVNTGLLLSLLELYMSSGRYYSPCMVADTIYVLIYIRVGFEIQNLFMCVWNL